MYVHRRTLVAVADRFLGVDCSLITSLEIPYLNQPLCSGDKNPMTFFPGAVFSCHRLKTPARRVATLSEYNEVRNGLGTMPAPSTNDVLYSGIPTGLNIPTLFKIN
jgi:hypothetical protein